MSTTIFTKPATISHQGTRFTLGTYEQMLTIAVEMRERPEFSWLLGCAGCVSACVTSVPCRCCATRRHQKRASGGAHFPILSRTEFLDRLRAYEDAVNYAGLKAEACR